MTRVTTCSLPVLLAVLILQATRIEGTCEVGLQEWVQFNGECSGPPGFTNGPPLCGPEGVKSDSDVCQYTSNGFLSNTDPHFTNGQYNFECVKNLCAADPYCGGYIYDGQVRFYSVDAGMPVVCSEKMSIGDCRAPYCLWNVDKGTCSADPDFSSCTSGGSDCYCTLKSNNAIEMCASEDARLVGGICYCPNEPAPEPTPVLAPFATMDIATDGPYSCIAGTWTIIYDRFQCADVLPTSTEISISATGEFRIFGTRGGQIAGVIDLGVTQILDPEALSYEYLHPLGTIKGKFGITADTYLMRGEVHSVNDVECPGATFMMSRVKKLVESPECEIAPGCTEEAPVATVWGKECISFGSNVLVQCTGTLKCGSYVPPESLYTSLGQGKCRDDSDNVGGVKTPIDHYTASFDNFERSDCENSCSKLLFNCVGYEWFDDGSQKHCSLIVPSSKNRTKIVPQGNWHYHHGFGGEIPTTVEAAANYECFQSINSRPTPYVMTGTTEFCCGGDPADFPPPEMEAMGGAEDIEQCKSECLSQTSCLGVTLDEFERCIYHQDKLQLRHDRNRCRKCSIKQSKIFFNEEPCCHDTLTEVVDVVTMTDCRAQCASNFICNAFNFDESQNKCYIFENSIINLQQTCETSCFVKRSNTFQHSPELSSKECSSATVIPDKETCISAATRMGIEFTFVDTKLEKEYPRGCWLDYITGDMHYNSYSGPSYPVTCPAARSQCRSICLDTRELAQLHSYQSCYKYSTQDLNLGPVSLTEIDRQHMTVDDCYLLCGGSKYFGVKYSTSGTKTCWCTDTMDSPRAQEQENCGDICGTVYPPSLSVDVSCIYKTTTSGCFTATLRKRCPMTTPDIMRKIPSITWVKQCEAACILDQSCTHFNWIASGSVKCVLLYSCPDNKQIGDPESDVYEKRMCPTDEDEISLLSTQKYAFALESNQGGLCNEPPLNPDAGANDGYCDYPVKLPARSCLRPEVEQDGISAAFEFEGTCVCSIPNGVWVGDCQLDGFCHAASDDGQAVDIATEFLTADNYDNTNNMATIGTYIGKGQCLDTQGSKYHYITRQIVPEQIDGEYVWKGDEYYFDRCQAWALPIAAKICDVVGIGFSSSSSDINLFPTCSLALLRVSPNRPYILDDTELPEAERWKLEDPSNDQQIYVGLPKHTNTDPNSVCFTYVAGPCSIADNCEQCSDSNCAYNHETGFCEIDSKKDVCNPMGRVSGTDTLASCAIEGEPQKRFLDTCHAAQVGRFGLTVDPVTQWPTAKQRTMTFLQWDAEHQVVWDYFRLTDKPSCSDAGYFEVTDQFDCMKGLCATSDIAWLTDSVPDATEDIGTDRYSGIPNGCSAKCNFVDNFCQVERARFVPFNSEIERPNCIESAKRGFYCICRRKRGPESWASATPGQCTVENVQAEYFVQEYGLGCGFRDLEGVKSFMLADVVDEQDCRDAACSLYNLRLSNPPIENLGNQPVFDDSTYRSLYSGTTDIEFPNRWTGGCSIRDGTQLYYVPPMKCEVFFQDSCVKEHGCTWSGGECVPIRPGVDLCTTAIPCLCKKLTIDQIPRANVMLEFMLAREDGVAFSKETFKGVGLLRGLERTFTGPDELFELRQYVRDVDVVIQSACFISSEDDENGACATINEETREIAGFADPTEDQKQLIYINITIAVPLKERDLYQTIYDDKLLKVFPSPVVTGWKNWFSRQQLKVQLRMSLIAPSQFSYENIAHEVAAGRLSDLFLETDYIAHENIDLNSICFASGSLCYEIDATNPANVIITAGQDIQDLTTPPQFLYIEMTVNVLREELSLKQIEYTKLLNDKTTQPLTNWVIFEVTKPKSAEILPVTHDVTYLPHLYVDTWGSGFAQTCNPNTGSTDGTIRCGTVDGEAPDDELIVDLAAGEVQTFVFNSYADPNVEMTIKKHFIRGKASMGVMVGGEPDMSGKSQVENGVNWYHCRTAKDAESGANVCKIKACGPFTVVLTAVESDASVRLSLCYPRRPCACDANVAADGKVHSKCVLAVPKKQIYSASFGGNVEVPSVMCECEENFTGPNCGTCTAGRFPQPGSSTSDMYPACSLECAHCGDERCGVYSEIEERCICKNEELTGLTCGNPCQKGKVGTFCTETHPVLEASFTKFFTTDNNVFTPPPWKVSPNSKAVITITTNNPQSVNLELIAKKNLAASQQAAQELPAPSKITIDAAYYGPVPTKRSSYKDPVKLHVLRHDTVYVYGVTDTDQFVFEASSPIKTYYSSINIQFCQEIFGSEWDRDYSSVLFLQDPGVTFGAPPFFPEITPGDWLVLIKGKKACAATGSDRKFSQVFEDYTELFGARWDYTSDGFVHPWTLPNDEEWDTISITGSRELTFVKGDDVTLYSGLTKFCCGENENLGTCACDNFYAPSADELMNDYTTRGTISDYTSGATDPFFRLSAMAVDQFAQEGRGGSSDGYPTVIFSEFFVFVQSKGGPVEKKPSGTVFSDMSLPASIYVKTKPGVDSLTGVASAQAGVLSGAMALKYSVVVKDEKGVVLSLDNDVIYPVLEECGYPLTSAQVNAKKALEGAIPAGDDGTTIDQFLKDQNDCNPPSQGGSLVGESSNGIIAGPSGQSVFNFNHIGINRAGRFKIKFLHPKSGVETESDHIEVSETDCDSEFLWGNADQCRRQCSEHQSWVTGETTRTCTLSLSNNKEWLQLRMTTVGFVNALISINLVQPCCNGRGICCAGNNDCTAHISDEVVFSSDEEHCTCIDDPIRGYWDQRVDSKCTKCKTGYSGDSCTIFDSDISRNTVYADVDQKPGITRIYAVPVSSETMFTVKLENQLLEDGTMADADVNVGFQQCPGQDQVLANPVLYKDQVALPCLGRGVCLVGDSGLTYCSCHSGYYDKTCDKQCCSLKGKCQNDGSSCQCFDDDRNGHWAPAVSKCRGKTCTTIGGADISESEKTFCVYRGAPTGEFSDNEGLAYNDCSEGIKTPATKSTKMFISWRDLPVSTAHNLEHAAIVFEEEGMDHEDDCQPNKIYIYATVTDNRVPSTGSFSDMNFPCDVAVLSDYNGVTCTSDSTFDSGSAKCLCDNSFSCVLGTCKQLSPNQRCGEKLADPANDACEPGWDWKQTVKDGDMCGCRSEQALSDELSSWVCENHVCLEQVLTMEHTWVPSDITSTSTSSNDIPAFQWQGGGTFDSRFFYEVASFDQPRAHDGVKREVLITDWLQKYTASLRTSTFSLSFAIVGIHGDNYCQIHTKNTPSFVMKTRGFRQPSRLFFGLENKGLSDQQHGQPFYNLYTADTHESLSEEGRLNSDRYRYIKRYEPYSARQLDTLCDGETCSCGKGIADGAEPGTAQDSTKACKCPQEAMFQDPTDFMQIGEGMFFLATSDWEGQSQDNSDPCNPSYQEDTPIFQGAREIFYTKGLPKSNILSSGSHELPRALSQFGSSQFPPLGGSLQPGDIREGILNTRVFTRAKELTKMANPDCIHLTSLLEDCYDADFQKVEREMAIYVTVNRGGDSVTVEKEVSLQPTIFSDNFPQLWRTRIKADGTPGESEVLANNVMFPSYVTRILGGDPKKPAFTRPNYLMFLGTDNIQSNKLLDSYFPLGGTGEVGTGSQGRGEGGSAASHATLAPKTLSVYWSDGTISNAKKITPDFEAGKCQHQQTNPGFVYFKDYIYFFFETTDGINLYRWLAGSSEEASPVSLSIDGGTVAFSLPPLSKGYTPLRVISGQAGAELLVLPLGVHATIEGEGEPVKNDPGGCFSETPYCASSVYVFQRAFKCVDPDRGITGLYSWNGDIDNNVKPKRISVGDPSLPETMPEDPKWQLITSAGGMFWVGHDTGMTNMGAFLSSTIDGQVYPAQQFNGYEKQTLWYAARNTAFATDDDEPFLTPRAIKFNYPVDMFGFKEWNHRLYFWAYDADQLAEVYNDMNNVDLTCFPPGRIQEVVSKEGTVLTKVMSGINVPAYHGCNRVMYSISITPTDNEVPVKVHEGTENDGVGVPQTQCCPNNFESDLPDSKAADREIQWPTGLKMSDLGGLQAGRSCKINEDADCTPNAALNYVAGTNYLAKGCISCYTKKEEATLDPSETIDGPPLNRDFVYPTHLWIEGGMSYSIDSLWNTPHSGWWYSGFQSFWLDPRSSRASGQYVTASGAAASKGGSKYIEGNEMYRPGGFSWREGWPEVFGVWEEVPDIIRNDCEDCVPGFFGKSCQLSCPVPLGSNCAGLDKDQCLVEVNDEGMPKCMYSNDQCIPKVCSGYPCSDGVYGNGTCLCSGRGVTCESTQIMQHVSEVSFDTLIYGSGHPTADDCTKSDCGITKTQPCCGRSPEPLKVTPDDHAVLTFNNINSFDALESVILRLHSVPGASCSSSTLTVRQLGSSLTDDKHTFDVVTTALKDASTQILKEVALEDTKSKILDIVLPVDKFISTTATTLVLSIAGDCFPMFTPLEFHEGWIQDCTTAACIHGSAPTGVRVRSDSPFAAKLIFSKSSQVNVNARGISSLTTHAHHFNHPVHRGVAELAVEEAVYDPEYFQQDNVKIIPSSEGAEKVFEDESCTLIGTTDVEECTKIVPLLAAYAFVKVTAFTRSLYTMSITYTPHGRFSPVSLYGNCVSNDDHGHWKGLFCLDCETGYQGGQCMDLLAPYGNCTTEECSPEFGTCVNDLKSGNVYQKCSCKADRYTMSCTVECKECGHGYCSPEGVCICFTDDIQGYWKGDKCDTCVEGYFSETCAKKCTCVNGICDQTSTDGRCLKNALGEPDCTHNYDGELCNLCKKDFFGLTCEDKCNAETCKGICDQVTGECSCTGDTYDPSRNCAVVCNAEICNHHGVCPNQNEAIADEYVNTPCTCYSNEAQGYWDYKTNCATCAEDWYGENCNIECISCSGSGRCVLDEETGEVDCECFKDIEHGFFEGSSCQRCMEGYTGASCNTALTSASEKKLGKAYDIFSETVAPKSNSGILYGAILHTNFIEINERNGLPLSMGEKEAMVLLPESEQTKEVLFVACGTKSTGTNALPIDVWVKSYDQSVDFRTGSWLKNFWVQASSSNGAVRGQAVRGIFQDGSFLYFIVEDKNSPYLARTWAMFTDACPLCLLPDDSSVGISINGIDTVDPEIHTSCTVTPGCAVNQQVYIIGDPESTARPVAGIVKEVAQSGLWIVTEFNTACTENCNTNHPNAHLYSHSQVAPLPSVAWWRASSDEGSSTTRYTIIDWKFSRRFHMTVVLFLEQHIDITTTDLARTDIAYHIQTIKTDTIEDFTLNNIPSEKLVTFDPASSARADSFYLDESEEDPVLLIFGKNNKGRVLLQKVFVPQTADQTYRKVLDIAPQVCEIANCDKIERLIPLRNVQNIDAEDRNSALLFIRTLEKSYVYQRLNMLSIKDQQYRPNFEHPVCKNYDEENCANNRCVWDAEEMKCGRPRMGIQADTQSRTGIGAVAVDESLGVLYYSLGSENILSPSILYKLDLLSLETPLIRTMSTGHLAGEVEGIVAAAADPVRRALFVVTRLSRTAIGVINLYDVDFITPNVADAPRAGTLITVSGKGFTTLGGAYSPRCKMGTTVGDGVFKKLNDEWVIICEAVVPESYSACNWLPLEIAINRDDLRWTETSALIKRTNTALILSLGTLSKDEIVGPVHDFRGLIPNPDASPYQYRTIQPVPTGHMSGLYSDGTNITITVNGAGFFESAFMKCRIGGMDVPGVFVTAVLMTCVQPQFSEPNRTTVEVSLDGQVFSKNDVSYYAVGEPTSMKAFYLCDDNSVCDAENLQVRSSTRVVLQDIAVTFHDLLDTFVGGSWAAHRLGSVTMTRPTGLSFDNLEIDFTQAPENGRVLFTGITLLEPRSTEEPYSLSFSYGVPGSDVVLGPVSVLLEVVGGDPVRVRLYRAPPPFTSNRKKLTIQPMLEIIDAAGNAVLEEQFEVVPSLANIPPELRENGEPIIEISAATGIRRASRTYDFEGLEIKTTSTTTKMGRELQFAERNGKLELLKFDLLFSVVKKTTKEVQNLDPAVVQMHMVDCRSAYVGNSKLAWIEPEEMPVSSTEPITIKGWEFKDVTGVGKYLCQFRSAHDGRFVKSVDATFVDSCSIECTPPADIRDTASVHLVQPALCCNDKCPDVTDPEENCKPSDPVSSFNESTLKIEMYHRYVGQPTTLKIWNLIAELPPPSVEYQPYVDALGKQTAVSQRVQVDASQSNGVRFFDKNDPRNYLARQYARTGVTYNVMMNSETVAWKETVLRSGAVTVIAGTNFWTENDWQSQQLNLQALNGTADTEPLDTSFRVGATDNTLGYNLWHGNWVGDHHAGSDAQITMTIKPLSTIPDPYDASKQLASIKFGPTYDVELIVAGQAGRNSVSRNMNHSYVEFNEVAMLYPAKGTYEVTFKHTELPLASVIIKVLEGLPWKVEFAEDGIPISTLTKQRELTTQPKFKLVDVALNILTELPAAHKIYVRVRSLDPWPRCLESVAGVDPDPSTPGMWGVEDRTRRGVCNWNTPLLSDMSEEAVTARRHYDPSFDATGYAEYGLSKIGSVMNIWAKEGESYNLTFMFYGPGLDDFNYTLADLSVPNLIVASRCAQNCPSSQRVCEFEPPTLDQGGLKPADLGTRVAILGDYYDHAQRKRPDPIRIGITFTVDQRQFLCQISADLRDPCSVTAIYPRCKYLCVNVYGNYTFAERSSCCKTGFRRAGSKLPCNPTSTASIEHNTNIRSVATLSDDSPITDHRDIRTLAHDARSVSTLAVASLEDALSANASTTTVSVLTCPATAQCTTQGASASGPPKIGEAVQFGISTANYAQSALEKNRISSAYSSPIPITITSKDRSGTDIFTKDPYKRVVRVTFWKSGATAADFKGPDCTQSQNCLRHFHSGSLVPNVCALDEPTECVIFQNADGSLGTNELTLVNGSATTYVVLKAPKEGSFMLDIEDITPLDSSVAGYAVTRLPACSGPYLDEAFNDLGSCCPKIYVTTGRGIFALPYPDSINCAVTVSGFTGNWFFSVTKGEPYRLGWATARTAEIKNEFNDIEYIMQVEDYAGNVLNKNDIAQKVSVQIDRSVPEMNNTDTAQLLFQRRGESYGGSRQTELERLACSYTVGVDDNNVVELGVGQNPSHIKFTLKRFVIWHGMSCLLSFKAVGADTHESIALADKLNLQTEASLRRQIVQPRPCCTGNSTSCAQFAYSFEIGCWNHILGKVIEGPQNKLTAKGSVLATVSAVNRYECLYKCGACENGMKCNGTVVQENLKGYWREPVSYRAWKCRASNCVASSLGPGLADTSGLPTALGEEDTIRSDRQCNQGSEGPLCGVCIREASPEAPNGYARDGSGCAKCSEPIVNYILLALSILALLVVIVIMVLVNLNVGKTVQEAGKVAVMLKLFLNHMQVSSLCGELALEWTGLINTIFDLQSKSGPTSNFVSLSCSIDFDYYTNFIAWMLIPILLVVAPGLLLLLVEFKRRVRGVQDLGAQANPEYPPECQSPYHWMYDWCIDGKDKAEELRTTLANHDRQTLKQKQRWKLNLLLRRLVNPRRLKSYDELMRTSKIETLEDLVEYTPIKIQRQAGEDSMWEAPFTLGTHGCWCCRRCCIMERLFPSPGVGRVGKSDQITEMLDGKVYQCDIPEHEITANRLQQLFREEMLTATMARWELVDKIESCPARIDDIVSFADAVFATDNQAGEDESEASDEEEELNNAAHRMKTLQQRKSLALSATPPLTVESHQPFNFPDFTAANRELSGTTVSLWAEDTHIEDIEAVDKVSLQKRKAVAIDYFYKEQGTGIGGDYSRVKHDKMVASRQYTGGDNSYWTISRTDIMSGEDHHWNTHEDPVTPPRSPTKGGELKGYIKIPITKEDEDGTTVEPLPGMLIF
eukprot:TRINITY_DN341_c4_g1_i2.p1 TRINITY_DN341_c4_g1~~TRINITY_DN341_c4_g1_i2.p1  ORF type:complete len:7778 (+),score=1455.78 TRINITY_DN341_c4_g1_i2:99-23432(+)